MEKKRFTLKKTERLTNKREISALFSGGKAITEFPFRLVYKEPALKNEITVKIAFAVPKRNFKHAVDRNLLKRKMREAYRLNKHELTELLQNEGQAFSIVLIYIGKKEMPYRKIEKSIKLLLQRLIAQVAQADAAQS